MKFIANILTKNLFNDNFLYNVVSDKDDLIEGLPTLCIGKEFTKKNYPNFRVIEFNVEDNVYWTYGPREKRNIYEERLNDFMEIAIKSFIDNFRYVFINVLISDKDNDDCKKLMESIKPENNTTSFISGNMVYVYNAENNCVYGVSLRDIGYKGKEPKKLLSMIFKNTRVINAKDDIPFEVRTAFIGNNYVIPCLYY